MGHTIPSHDFKNDDKVVTRAHKLQLIESRNEAHSPRRLSVLSQINPQFFPL
jgi:hypothetical protein